MYLKVTAITGAKKENLVKKKEDHFVISVREKPERNLANIRIRELVAIELNVALGAVRILNGHHERGKILSIKLPTE